MKKIALYGKDERSLGKKPPIELPPFNRFTSIIVLACWCEDEDDIHNYNSRWYEYYTTLNGKEIISERVYDPIFQLEDFQEIPSSTKRFFILPLFLLYLGLKTQTKEDFLV
jgi:hypothetical protein